MLVVFIANLTELTKESEKKLVTPPTKVLLGIGYGPTVKDLSERLEMLDFFNWIKVMQDPELIIWNAGIYAIVNRISPKKIKGSYKEILETIATELQDPNKSEWINNGSARQKYLHAMMETTGTKGKVINAYDTLLEKKFIECFEYASEFCKKLEKTNPELVKKAMPKVRDAANSLYTALEIAEALYLEDIDVKFGNETERKYDNLIVRAKDNYRTILCPNPPIGIETAYLKGTKENIRFKDDIFEIRKKLGNETYRNWIEEIIEPFSDPNMYLEENIDNIVTEVRTK